MVHLLLFSSRLTFSRAIDKFCNRYATVPWHHLIQQISKLGQQRKNQTGSSRRENPSLDIRFRKNTDLLSGGNGSLDYKPNLDNKKVHRSLAMTIENEYHPNTKLIRCVGIDSLTNSPCIRYFKKDGGYGARILAVTNQLLFFLQEDSNRGDVRHRHESRGDPQRGSQRLH